MGSQSPCSSSTFESPQHLKVLDLQLRVHLCHLGTSKGVSEGEENSLYCTYVLYIFFPRGYRNSTLLKPELAEGACNSYMKELALCIHYVGFSPCSDQQDFLCSALSTAQLVSCSWESKWAPKGEDRYFVWSETLISRYYFLSFTQVSKEPLNGTFQVFCLSGQTLAATGYIMYNPLLIPGYWVHPTMWGGAKGLKGRWGILAHVT